MSPKPKSPNQEGVARSGADLFSYGSQSLGRLPFQKALDDIAANESAGATFSLQVLSSQFDRGLDLLADNELHPAFVALPGRHFPIVREQLAQNLAGELQTPDYRVNRAILAAEVPKGDPMLRQAMPDEVMKLKLSDVNAWYQAAFRPDLTTIVIVGDISPDRPPAAVLRDFGRSAAQGQPQ